MAEYDVSWDIMINVPCIVLGLLLESDDAIEYSKNIIIRCFANEVRPEVLHSSV